MLDIKVVGERDRTPSTMKRRQVAKVVASDSVIIDPDADQLKTSI